MARRRKYKTVASYALAAAVVAFPNSSEAQIASKRCNLPVPSMGGPSNGHTRYVENNILPAVVQSDTKPSKLVDRMAAYNVPGVSVAVIHNGKLDWARGWGVRDSESCLPVNPNTIFQAASISKAVTAVVALRLAEIGQLNLDSSINNSLRSWQLLVDPQLAPNGVTLRQLLSHTAGLGVHGFAGYSPSAPLPSITQILDGASPANNPAVRSVLPVGKQWQYSGGGYVIIQSALADVERKSFATIARREVLQPLQMKHSAYALSPSKRLLANTALGHIDGKPIEGGFHVYPELAPAGLWTTAGDLARFLLDIQKSATGQKGHRLSPSMANQMLTAVQGNWGLGPALYGDGEGRRFGHDGANEGFQSTMVAYVNKGEGVVVLTNGDQGKRLADEIVRAVATDYGWSELVAAPIVEVGLPKDIIAKIVGQYEGSGLSVFLDARSDGLYAQTGGPRPERLVALTATKFRTDASGILVEFAPNYQSFRILEGGPPIQLIRSIVTAAELTEVPMFVRGSMNDWSTTAPLASTSNGEYSVNISLKPGEYLFKLGSADWKQADFGTSAGETVKTDGAPLQLIQHGGNIKLSIERAGNYQFNFRTTDGGKGTLIVTEE